MTRTLLLIVFLISGIAASAQNKGSVKGRLVDTTAKMGLADATISVVNRKDSSLVTFTLSVKGGNFEVKGLDPGEYKLMISYQTYQPMKKDFDVTAEKMNEDLGEMVMSKEYKTLDGVVVTDDSPVKIKGDTIAFSAEAFKTKPNATVEDLLKKMPGMQVEKDGTVKAQGENVQKVYVDGKEFFGNDPKLATKNLNADMIDQVEVFDDMSEQARFNKIDDGSRSKAINLKLKKDKKKGIFGKVHAGYGTNERYDAGLNANFFKGATQVSVIGKANNTNNIGFTMSDMMGMFSGGGGGGMIGIGGMQIIKIGGGGGGSMLPGGFNMGSGGSGITSSWQAGLNYRDTWSKKFDVNGSYFFNHAASENVSKTYRQTFLNDTVINRDQVSAMYNTNNNHRLNFNVIYQIDSFNSIIYTPNISFQESSRLSDDSSVSFSEQKGTSFRTNDNRAFVQSEGTAFNWTNNLIWRKRFRRIGRTLSVNLNNTYSNSDRDGLNRSRTGIYNSTGDLMNEIRLNQQSDLVNETNNVSVSTSYTEPLAKDKTLEVNYGYSRNANESDKKTYDYNSASDKYDIPNASLTNLFQNLNETNRFGTNFRVTKKKYNYQLGVSVQRTLLESDNITKDSLISQRFTNIFPNASFNYNFAKSKSFRFSYRGRTNQPTVSQLQDVVDITDPLNPRSGNPSLDQEFSNNFTLSYNFFDMVKFRNLFAMVNFSNTYNKIINSTTSLGGGSQYTVPVNMNGAYSLMANINFGLPIKRMKGGNFNTTTRLNMIKNPTLTDGIKGHSKSLVAGQDFRLNYNHKDKLDMGVSASLTFNSDEYSIQGTRNRYFTHAYSADVSYILPKNFIISSDFDYTFYTGRSDGYNQNYMMWNAGIAKQLFKSKKGEIKFSVYDLLKQNVNVTRNTGDNYIEDVQNTTLQRFFMLTFTYNINRMAGKNMKAPAMMERGMRDIRIIQ